MSACLLDTHTWAWSLYKSSNLSQAARRVMVAADAVWVSPVSFYEIAQKVRLRKWPEMEPLVGELVSSTQRQKASIARLDADICISAGQMTWPHRDPFDRLLAATALSYGLPIVSADTAFDGLVSRIW